MLGVFSALGVVGRKLLRLTEEAAMSHASKARLPTYSKATAATQVCVLKDCGIIQDTDAVPHLGTS